MFQRTAAEEDSPPCPTLAGGAASTSNWQPRSSDLKTIYNRSAVEAPAELFRKDLISAMKLPDSEPLANDEYWVIMDQWKQEWERGVQVSTFSTFFHCYMICRLPIKPKHKLFHH